MFRSSRFPRSFFLGLVALPFGLMAELVRIDLPADQTGLDYGLAQLRAVLTAQDHTVTTTADTPPYVIVSVAFDPALSPQSFSLDTSVNLALTAADAAGATYGLLDLTEQIRLHGLTHVLSTTQAPAQLERGVKFNIPLDVRTPTYTEPSAAAQNAMEHVWDRTFWFDYLDHLASQRYNLVSLWNLHPFPSMVRVPAYPDVALDDVRKSTTTWAENYSLQAIGFDAPEIVDHYRTIKTMTMDEKIAFWREIMAYAKARHIKFYVITWNIFVNGTAGKYGITADITNPVTQDYFRQSVRAMFDTYPDLAGIGLTTGENMPGSTFEAKEDWAFATYGRGVLDAAESSPDPNRQFTFIHRQHQTKARDIATKFQPLIDAPNINFLFSYKYAQAHVMSSTRQPFAAEFIQDIPPQKTLWTLRNDDNYLFRWGGSNFVREFIQNLPADVSAGMYYGSDQWVWTRKFLSTEPTQPRTSSLTKHWFHWLLWGRLAYDPTLSDERLIELIDERFPTVHGATLFAAWNEAAMVYPLTTGFHWGALDFQWYIEACQSQPRPAQTPSGFHDINRFISLPPHPRTDMISIPQLVEALTNEQQPPGITSLQVATELIANAQSALAKVDSLDPTGDQELRQTLEDIRAQAYLGFYYGYKIRAATELALLRNTLSGHYRASLHRNLNQAAYYWRLYTATAQALYHLQPLWTNRVGYVDLAATFQHVLYDLTITGGVPNLASAPPTPGGTLLEAETADSALPVSANVAGFTGSGYRQTSHAGGAEPITWTFVSPRPGTFLLEFRHLQRHGALRDDAPLSINGTSAPEFALTASGTGTNWVWDRATVTLVAGPNTITLTPSGSSFIDHLNIIDTGY